MMTRMIVVGLLTGTGFALLYYGGNWIIDAVIRECRPTRKRTLALVTILDVCRPDVGALPNERIRRLH
jgi:hypothetical protein